MYHEYQESYQPQKSWNGFPRGVFSTHLIRVFIGWIHTPSICQNHTPRVIIFHIMLEDKLNTTQFTGPGQSIAQVVILIDNNCSTPLLISCVPTPHCQTYDYETCLGYKYLIFLLLLQQDLECESVACPSKIDCMTMMSYALIYNFHPTTIANLTT